MSSDLNNDGVISIKDINMLLSEWDTSKQTSLDNMLSSYNEPSPQPEPEPEVDTSLFDIINDKLTDHPE